MGQCGYDHSQLTSMLSEFKCEITRAKTRNEALHYLEKETFDLILVNRIIDYDGSSGLELVKSIIKNQQGEVMLVSDIEDAQREAVAAGALPGFGKSQLRAPGTREKIEKAFLVKEKSSGHS